LEQAADCRVPRRHFEVLFQLLLLPLFDKVLVPRLAPFEPVEAPAKFPEMNPADVSLL
jgi:hypothetical protein